MSESVVPNLLGLVVNMNVAKGFVRFSEAHNKVVLIVVKMILAEGFVRFSEAHNEVVLIVVNMNLAEVCVRFSEVLNEVVLIVVLIGVVSGIYTIKNRQCSHTCVVNVKVGFLED